MSSSSSLPSRPGWVHHAQQRRKWGPTVVKVAALATMLGYFAFMLSLTQQPGASSSGGGGGGGTKSATSALTSLFGLGGGGGKAGLKLDAQGRRVIAYAISVTADGPYMDGAAVLAHGIRQASKDSKYGMDLIALVHPNVSSSRVALRRAGWK